MITIDRENGGAMYLVKDKVLYRIAGGSLSIGLFDFTRLSSDGINNLSLSPNGCRLAYSHYPVPAYRRTGTLIKMLTLIDLCKE